MSPKYMRYIGTTDLQVRFGGNDDPRGLLKENEAYEVLREDVHDWHTDIFLADFPDKRFNSVSFVNVKITPENDA